MPISDARLNEWMTKVLEQLVGLSSDLNHLKQQIVTIETSFNKSLDETTKTINGKLDEINELINGNGNPEKGLIIRTDRLEQDSKRQKWIIKTLFTAIAGSLIASVMNWIKK